MKGQKNQWVTWSPEQMEAVKSLAGEIHAEAKNEYSDQENMLLSLLPRIDGVDHSTVVSRLCKGIQDFQSSLELANASSSAAALDKGLAEALVGLSLGDQKQILIGILDALEEEGAAPCEEKAAADVDSLRAVVAERYMQLGGTELDEVSLQLDEETAAKLNEAFAKEDSHSLALAFYIMQARGELDIGDVPPEAIGTISAATVEAAKVMDNAKKGLFSKETCDKILRLILKIVVIILFLAFLYILIQYAPQVINGFIRFTTQQFKTTLPIVKKVSFFFGVITTAELFNMCVNWYRKTMDQINDRYPTAEVPVSKQSSASINDVQEAILNS